MSIFHLRLLDCTNHNEVTGSSEQQCNNLRREALEQRVEPFSTIFIEQQSEQYKRDCESCSYRRFLQRENTKTNELSQHEGENCRVVHHRPHQPSRFIPRAIHIHHLFSQSCYNIITHYSLLPKTDLLSCKNLYR
jgi:hypothetical protein